MAMDLSTEAITASKQAMVGAQVQVAVLRKALDTQAAVGQELVQMMAEQTGVGRSVDVQA